MAVETRVTRSPVRTLSIKTKVVRGVEWIPVISKTAGIITKWLRATCRRKPTKGRRLRKRLRERQIVRTRIARKPGIPL